VLDNAGDKDPVCPLVPGAGGAAVIVTARRRLFGLSHARWTKLEPLAESEGVALLEHMLGSPRIQAEPTEARHLVELTSGLPQVVYAVGARLSSRPSWSLATAVRRLSVRGRDPEWGFEECSMIEDRYESAVEELTRGQARAFRLLAVSQAPDFSLATAAAVLDLPVDKTESLLESLADVHLLETADERYHFHNPIKSYARTRALMEEGEAACQAVLIRLTHFTAATFRNALLANDPGLALVGDIECAGLDFDSPDAARAWMTDEQQNLWEIRAQAAELRDAPTKQLNDLIDMALR
jgi:phage tail protein X